MHIAFATQYTINTAERQQINNMEKFMFRNKATGLMLILALGVNSSYASEWYWGAGAGSKKVLDLCSDSNPDNCEDSSLNLRGTGGLRFNKIFAVEAALDFSSGYVSPHLQNHSEGNFDLFTLQINALFFIPITKRVSLLTGIGPCLSNVSYDKNDVFLNHTTASQNRNKHQKTGNNQVSGFFDLFDGDGDSHHNNNDDDGSNSSRDYSTDSNVSDACASGLIGVETAITEKSSLRAQAQYFSQIDGGYAFRGNNETASFTVSYIHKF